MMSGTSTAPGEQTSTTVAPSSLSCASADARLLSYAASSTSLEACTYSRRESLRPAMTAVETLATPPREVHSAVALPHKSRTGKELLL